MHFRKLIFLFLLPLWLPAQVTYPVVDSLSWNYYVQGNWNGVDSIGRVALKNGIDYPYLRMRMGYADFCKGNFSRSMSQYKAALKQDKGNATARWYLYQNNLLLGRYEIADLYASDLPDTLKKIAGWKKFVLCNQADGELTGKFTSSTDRSGVAYARIGLGSRFGKRFSLYQSVSFYKQDYYYYVPDTAFRPRPGFPPPLHPPLVMQTDQVRQWQYYGRVGVQLSPVVSLWAAGNYLSSGQSLFGAGTKLQFPYFSVNAEGEYGTLSGISTWQAGGGFTYYPFGNAKLYLFAKGAYVQSGATYQIYSGGCGVKIGKRAWLEAMETNGRNQNYSENMGLYIYNMSDVNLSRFTCSLYLPLGDHAQVGLHYSYEKQELNTNKQLYSQNSITGGIIWKR